MVIKKKIPACAPDKNFTHCFHVIYLKIITFLKKSLEIFEIESCIDVSDLLRFRFVSWEQSDFWLGIIGKERVLRA